MSKHDRQARPVYHHKRDSIEAHLTIMFAALAVSRWIEDQTGWPVRQFVHTARRYRTIQIQAGNHTITADPARRPPPGLRSHPPRYGAHVAQLGTATCGPPLLCRSKPDPVDDLRLGRVLSLTSLEPDGPAPR